MKFQNFDSFVTEKYAPINEAKEKFKISPAKVSHKNGEAAFVVKYVGPQFDQEMLRTFMSTDPTSAPSLQKVTQNPEQYFFIYRTLKSGETRFLAPNSKVWATYLELVNALGPNGQPIYVGFNKPPYNNFVKWSDAERLVNTQDPQAAQTGKTIVDAISNSGTQQANDALSDAEKTVATDAQAFLSNQKGSNQPAATGTHQTLDPQVEKIVDSFKGIAMGSRGPKVDLLQNTIEQLAKYTHNTNAEQQNQLNVRQGGEFDDIYGVNTAHALQTVLGLDSAPESIDATIIAKIKEALAGTSGITAEMLTTKEKNTPVTHKQAEKSTTGTASQATHTAQPAQAAAQPNSLAGLDYKPTHAIETNKGKIKF